MEEKNNNSKEKEKRIKKEMQKLKKLYKELSKEKMTKISELIYRASFLLVMIQDMEQEIIQYENFVTTTINASQTFIKTNPLLKDYRDTIKTYQSVLKQLEDLTKDENLEPIGKDELDEWLNK